ncbi:MAG: hypothetical protein FJ303_08640 [Planctomycetes bacterium]|nr:hypothetical protein [Planctomycetota bacterium]
MLTKMFAAMLLTGAVWVAGDAAYERLGCCHSQSECGELRPTCGSTSQVRRDCCSAAKNKASDCCSKRSDCCSAGANAKGRPCCDAAYTYCTQTGDVYEGCCCEVVNGRFLCLITGIVSDECCCIPLK